MLPLDHPIYFGPQKGTEDPAALLALARNHGATAVLLTAGALRSAVHEVGDLGIILRIDATLSHMGGPDTIMHLLQSAEEASGIFKKEGHRRTGHPSPLLCSAICAVRQRVETVRPLRPLRADGGGAARRGPAGNCGAGGKAGQSRAARVGSD